MSSTTNPSTQHTSTIGAIGAPSRRNTELALLVFAVVIPVFAYANVGLAIAFAVMRLAPELLYGVSPADPVVFGSVVAIIAVVGLLACWLPARRAAALDPLKALRHD